MARAGRHGDTQLAHVTPGEMVVPERVLGQGDTGRQLIEGFAQAGLPIGRYRVGGMDDSRNPMTGMREFFDPGDMESGQDPGVGGGYGDMDGGPAETGFDFGQAQAAQDAVSLADFGRDMHEGPVSTDFNPEQYAEAQAWGDYEKGYNVAKHLPFGLGLWAKAIDWGVKTGVLPSPMTRAELARDRADWEARGPMTGGVGADRATEVPKNGLAPSRERGVYTPEPTYLKYMREVQVA